MADDGKIDPHSPYYLGSGDQPGNMITHVILSNDNYIAWARAIKLSLKARRKFMFVDGTFTKPTETEKKKQLDWDTVNSMLVSWITRTLDPKLAASIPFHDEAKRLWDYLEKRFCVANGPRLQQLRADITHCKQTSNMSIDDYYTCLMGLYDDWIVSSLSMRVPVVSVLVMLLVDSLRIGKRRNSINFSLALTMSYMQRYVLICCPLLLSLISIVCIKHVFRKKSLGVLLEIERTRRKSMRLLYKLHDPRLVLPVPINQNCIVLCVSDRVMMTILVSKRMDIRIGGKIGTVESKAVHGPIQTPPPAAPPTVPRGRPKAVAATVVVANAVAGGGTDSVASAHGSSGISLPDLKPEQDLSSGSLIRAGERDIFVSRDVKFHENEFPYKTVSTSQVPAYSSSPPDSNVGIDVDCLEDLESALVDDHVAPANWD
ncbi:hypothetical protein F0562_007959 [Nyssa sinensis]|uniref:Retrotransposon Copia-like N-terminal domain-containing protein n=1 Tax=Nyssa sinensis TaxID=561372 RepID=A0A5J5A9F6_9ASTE|nr:hypothetical protein F0562_007959 [Nyssa sinensis]